MRYHSTWPGCQVTWLGGGAVTDTGAPKSLNETSSVLVSWYPPPSGSVIVVTSRRTWPWRSTYTVPVTEETRPDVATVNPYLVPVQPGPEVGPSLVTVPADLSRASSAPGSTACWLSKPGLTTSCLAVSRGHSAASDHGFGDTPPLAADPPEPDGGAWRFGAGTSTYMSRPMKRSWSGPVSRLLLATVSSPTACDGSA